MAATAELSQDKVRNLIWVSHMGEGFTDWDIFCCFLRCISRQLDQKLGSWDLNQHSYEIVLL